MSANTNTSTKTELSADVKAVFTKTIWTKAKALAKSVEDTGQAAMLSQLDFGRYLLPIVAKAVEAGAKRNDVLDYFVAELATKGAPLYEASHVGTWITASEGYDSLTAKQRVFRSLDAYRKIASLPVEADDEGNASRSDFVDMMIAAGVKSEKDVRTAISDELKARRGEPNNELTRIRKQSEKVSKQAGRDVTRLSKILPNGVSAKIFLLGAQWAAGQIDKQKGFNVKAYKDGFAEALHPLTIQPDTPAEKTDTPAAAKRTRKSAK